MSDTNEPTPFDRGRGDQMSFVEKIAQNVAQPFLSKLTHNLNCGKKQPTMWATSVFKKTLSRVNNHPSGENSPDLVTLIQC
jgi:hypothetical protein